LHSAANATWQGDFCRSPQFLKHSAHSLSPSSSRLLLSQHGHSAVSCQLHRATPANCARQTFFCSRWFLMSPRLQAPTTFKPCISELVLLDSHRQYLDACVLHSTHSNWVCPCCCCCCRQSYQRRQRQTDTRCLMMSHTLDHTQAMDVHWCGRSTCLSVTRCDV
jgi:hypothetical protein